MNIEINVNYVIFGSIFALLIILGCYIYKKTRKIVSIHDLPRNPTGIRISGIVTSISDGDGFKFIHVPLFGSSNYKPTDPKLSIRLAGIDAPETLFYGVPAQPFSKESKDYLAQLVFNEKVVLDVLSVDRYGRILAIVHKRSYCFSTNINLEMLREGLACVYKGSDEIYGTYKNEMIEIEKEARENKKGMWAMKNLVLPMDYKKLRKIKKKTVK
ncbi:hypothetical protein P3W45_000575 [Vairimorpha bombi]|jgi:endonuclease YncB( thermonuclease family)